MYRGNIRQIRIGKIFDTYFSTFLLLSLSLIFFLAISGVLEFIIKFLSGFDIFGNITFKNNNIPYSINLEASFFGPFREELVKIIPLIFLSYPLNDKYKKIQFINIKSINQVIIYGLMSGSIFTSVEFLFYYFTLSNQDSFHFTRFLTPMHIVTTTILSIGVYYFFKVKEDISKKPIRIYLLRLIPVFILSWAIHIIWNTIPQIVSFYVYTNYPVEKYGISINMIQNNYYNYVFFFSGLLLNFTILFIVLRNSKSNLGIDLDNNS